MAENRKSEDRSYFFLSRTQLFILAVASIIASTIFFFLGILIGQSIEERKLLQREEPAVKIPIQPDLRATEEEMTFYDTLTNKNTQPESRSPTEGGVEPKRPASDADGNPENRASTWSVQVTAFQNRNDAARMAAELAEKGYASFVVSGQSKGKTWHRVRVGKYAAREEAMVMLKELQAVSRYRNAIITRDN